MLHSYHVFFIDGENDESRIHWVSGCPILEIHVLRIMRLLYINVQCGKKNTIFNSTKYRSDNFKNILQMV